MGIKWQRRTLSAEFKPRVVLKMLMGQKMAAQVCRELHLRPDLVSRWKAAFVTHASSVFGGERGQQRPPPTT
jgi:transposase-like protein